MPDFTVPPGWIKGRWFRSVMDDSDDIHVRLRYIWFNSMVCLTISDESGEVIAKVHYKSPEAAVAAAEALGAGMWLEDEHA